MYADELKKYANEETVAVPPPMEVKLQELAEGSGLCPDSPLSAIPCAHFICHPLCAALSIFPLFFRSTLRCHRVSAAITFSITSQ